jgi:hypothetical protein
LARTVSIDFKFPEHINQGLSALTRSTKEAALLLSGSSFRSTADENPKPPPPASIHPTGLGQSSLSSLLSPMNISPLTISPNYTPSTASPSIGSFPSPQQQQQQQNGGLNKFDPSIVQMRQQQGQGPPGAETTTMKNLPPPPIVSIPLPRE